MDPDLRNKVYVFSGEIHVDEGLVTLASVYALEMNFEDFFPSFQIWFVHSNLSIKTARSCQSLIQNIDSVCTFKDHNTSAWVESSSSPLFAVFLSFERMFVNKRSLFSLFSFFFSIRDS